jgi:acetone carboxylase gamma subunit
MPELSYPKDVIRDLIDAKLPWEQVKQIISGYKDEDRFDKYREVLQEKMSWKEKILLPLTDELFIVEKGDERIVKCSCGFEFGDYRENWKLKALIHVRESQEEIEELYPATSSSKPDLELCEIREYYCPGCGSQLEVEAVPFGYPVMFDFLPDLDTFYSDWLGKPLKTTKEFTDLSHNVIQKWHKGDNDA